MSTGCDRDESTVCLGGWRWAVKKEEVEDEEDNFIVVISTFLLLHIYIGSSENS